MTKLKETFDEVEQICDFYDMSEKVEDVALVLARREVQNDRKSTRHVRCIATDAVKEAEKLEE